jgi:hypothetical protein
MRKENFFRIFGIVSAHDTQKGIPGLRVRALDKDLFFDDRLGSATTDDEGRFEIRYTESDFRDFFDLRSDIYLKIIDADGTERFTTEDKVRYEADDTERFVVELPHVVEPIGNTADLMRRLLGDKALLSQLSTAIQRLFSKDGLVMEAGLGYLFTPVVYKRPLFKGETFAPRLIDGAAITASEAPGWINPVDGVMPPYLHQQRYREVK